MGEIMADNIIQQRVALARKGAYPKVIGRMTSGWLVVADTQLVQGYCVPLADPPVSLSLLHISEPKRPAGTPYAVYRLQKNITYYFHHL